MLKKSHPGTFQRRKPKIRFPSCLQNQALENPFLVLVARPWAPQAEFQQPAKRLSLTTDFCQTEKHCRDQRTILQKNPI